MANIILKQKFRIPQDVRSYTEEIDYTIQEYKQESILDLKHKDYRVEIPDFQKVINYSTQEYKQNTNLKNEDKKYNYTFTNSTNNATAKEIECMRNLFKSAQENGSFLWKTYISFDNEYLKEMNIIQDNFINEDLLKTILKKSFCKMLENEKIFDYSFLGNIHYDTDNIHAHFYTVENGTPTRKLDYENIDNKLFYKQGKFKQKSIKIAKSEIQKSLNKDYENLKDIHNIFREKLLNKKLENLENFSQKEHKTILYILNNLPENKNLWQVNRKNLEHIKPVIINFTKNYLENYHSENLETFKKLLLKQEKFYEKQYGTNKDFLMGNYKSNNYANNKLEELITRKSNEILTLLKDVDKKGIEKFLNQNELFNKKENSTLDDKDLKIIKNILTNKKSTEELLKEARKVFKKLSIDEKMKWYELAYNITDIKKIVEDRKKYKFKRTEDKNIWDKATQNNKNINQVKFQEEKNSGNNRKNSLYIYKSFYENNGRLIKNKKEMINNYIRNRYRKVSFFKDGKKSISSLGRIFASLGRKTKEDFKNEINNLKEHEKLLRKIDKVLEDNIYL